MKGQEVVIFEDFFSTSLYIMQIRRLLVRDISTTKFFETKKIIKDCGENTVDRVRVTSIAFFIQYTIFYHKRSREQTHARVLSGRKRNHLALVSTYLWSCGLTKLQQCPTKNMVWISEVINRGRWQWSLGEISYFIFMSFGANACQWYYRLEIELLYITSLQKFFQSVQNLE